MNILHLPAVICSVFALTACGSGSESPNKPPGLYADSGATYSMVYTVKVD